jgi:DNA-binding CsgD family transcriptional regulator
MLMNALATEEVDLMCELMHKHPELTRAELRICALVRSGRTSREIASLLGCSIRNIENHRYRIGRKMKE